MFSILRMGEACKRLFDHGASHFTEAFHGFVYPAGCQKTGADAMSVGLSASRLDPACSAGFILYCKLLLYLTGFPGATT